MTYDADYLVGEPERERGRGRAREPEGAAEQPPPSPPLPPGPQVRSVDRGAHVRGILSPPPWIGGAGEVGCHRDRSEVGAGRRARRRVPRVAPTKGEGSLVGRPWGSRSNGGVVPPKGRNEVSSPHPRSGLGAFYPKEGIQSRARWGGGLQEGSAFGEGAPVSVGGGKSQTSASLYFSLLLSRLPPG